MNTQEKLERIKARCLVEVADCDRCDSILSDAHRRARAAAKATIAAIEGLLLIATEGQEPERGSACFDLGKILAAWPDEIL